MTATRIAANASGMRHSPSPSPLCIARRAALPVLLIGAASALALGCSSADDDAPNTSAGSGGAPVGSDNGGAGGAAAGASNGGGGGAPAAACPESAAFCDDFEDAALGAVAAPWRESTNQATVNVDEVQAYSGTKAVHVNAPQAGTYHRGYFALDEGSSAGIFPSVALEMYGRAMMYLPVLPNADVHWTFIQGEGRAADDTHNALYRYGGQHQGGAQLMANYETTMPVRSDCWDHSATLLPVARWTCVEWRFSVASNEMQFWMDGSELTDIHVTGQGEGCVADDLGGQWIAPPAFQTLYLGWEHYQQTANPIDLWVDDVAVGTERLGCPPAP
jgi:hypothetical protein